mgnify:CR=1 FL=1
MDKSKGVLMATVFERLSPQRFEDLLWFREGLIRAADAVRRARKLGKSCRVSS